MKSLKKTLMAIIAAIFGIVFFASCEKDAFFNQVKPPVDPSQESPVKLYCSTGAKDGPLEVMSGQTIYTDSLYSTLFYLSPSEGNNIARGDFEIKQNGVTILMANSVNGIPHKFPHGSYTLNVTNVTLNNTSYASITNVTIVSGPQTPPIVNEATFPIRLYNLGIEANQVSVMVRANITQWGNISANTFEYIKRVNEQGWMTGPATRVGDSVTFKLTFPKTHGSYIEFNARYMPQNNWLTPSYGNPPSILYNGPGIPYSDSQSYFGFKLIQNGNTWELRTYNGTLLLTSSPAPESIPGNYGDGPENNFQVRWAGEKIFFRTTSSNTVRYRINNGAWNYVAAATFPGNSNYKFCVQEIPNGNTANTVVTQWGNGNSDVSFVPATAEISNSSFSNPTPGGQGTAIVVYQ